MSTAIELFKPQRNNVYNFDARVGLGLLNDNSVDCVITSPPYYMQRDYQTDTQLGQELHPLEFVRNMTKVFKEVYRVLKPTGTVWLNIDDTYTASGHGWGGGSISEKYKHHEVSGKSRGRVAPTGFKRKELMGIPHRLVFALQEMGFYWRDELCWWKRNTMPESVTDRCTRTHEFVFMLTKSEKYFYNQSAIKEPSTSGDANRPRGSAGVMGQLNSGRRVFEVRTEKLELRNKRSVWDVPANPTPYAHFATFPELLIEPMVLAGCPEGGVIVDPFFGSGTVGRVAQKHKRDWIGFDTNAEYCHMARMLCAGRGDEYLAQQRGESYTKYLFDEVTA